MQNKRQDQLLTILRERQDWMTSRQLSGLLKVSDRTIRSDVDAINKGLTPPPIESNVRQGYRVKSGSVKEVISANGTDVPQTPGARCIYIIQKLLFEVRELNLVFLQDQLYVSASSLENDIKRIRRMLEPYANLSLVRNKECISLSGDEASKRRFYRDLLVAEINDNFFNLNSMAKLYNGFDLIEVKNLFVETIDQYGYSIHETLFPMLILHAGTSIERMGNYNYLDMEDKAQGLSETIEYEIARNFFDKIASRLHIKVQDGEVGRFALVIMGRRASNYSSDFVSFEGRWLNMKTLVTEGLSQINEIFGVDFSHDEDLIAGLKMHVHGLVERLKNKVALEDGFLNEIKQKYPMVFEMGVYIVEYLEEKLGAGISEVESGFIALHLGAASERLRSLHRYRAVMIMPHNQSFSDMCEKKISDMFRERMEIVKCFCYFEEDAVMKLDPDLILTTCPIKHKLDITTVAIRLFVDSETEASILQALNKLKRKRFRLEFTSKIGNLMRKEHFYQNLDARTPGDIIDILCKDLEKAEIVDTGFREVVRKREEMSPTSFVNAFAIPHAFGAFAKSSTIAVAQLKTPVKWGTFEVSLVMLFAINEGDQRMIKVFFDWVSNIIENPEELALLCRSCCYEEFMDRMME